MSISQYVYNKRRSTLKQYVVGAPMECLAMDILGLLLLNPRGNKFILVVTDYFTKWTESYSILNQEASTVAEKLVGEFICPFCGSTGDTQRSRD